MSPLKPYNVLSKTASAVGGPVALAGLVAYGLVSAFRAGVLVGRYQEVKNNG